MKYSVFSIVPIEVFGDKRLTLEQMRVLGVLLSFRGKDTNLAFPKRSDIAERCGMHPANISSATSALERLGWIKKEGKGGHSRPTRFTFSIPETAADQATVAEPAAGGVAQQATRLRIADSATGSEHTREQTSEQIKRDVVRSPKGSRLPSDWVLPNDYFQWSIETLGWSPDRCRHVSDVFADYWKATPGAKGIKADWLATWRNWCRREGGATQALSSKKHFSETDYSKGLNNDGSF